MPEANNANGAADSAIKSAKRMKITGELIIPSTNGEQINKSLKGKEIKKKANLIILFLSILVFILASKGYSILYLFLLANPTKIEPKWPPRACNHSLNR